MKEKKPAQTLSKVYAFKFIYINNLKVHTVLSVHITHALYMFGKKLSLV